MAETCDGQVIAEFSTADAPVDSDGVRTHIRATELLALIGTTPTEQLYLAAADAVGYAIHGGDADLEHRLEAAEALHDLAQFDLAAAGLTDDEGAYIELIERLGRETGLR